MKTILTILILMTLGFSNTNYYATKSAYKIWHDTLIKRYDKKEKEKNIFAFIFGPIIAGVLTYAIKSSIDNKIRLDNLRK